MKYLFTAAEYVAWLMSCVGLPYWYGTYYNRCTADLLTRKTKQYPGHYTPGRKSRYLSDITKGLTAGDCVGGAIKGAVWSLLGKQAPKYGTSGCPDKSADGMFAWCKEQGMDWGAIKTIPERPGLAVRFAGHVGVYLGNGRVFEWRGFAYGAVLTQLSARPWTHWYALPWVDYGKAPAPAPAPSVELGGRLLRRGVKGEDVRMLQRILMDLGHKMPIYGADGDFGSETEKAVKAFQARERLVIDGIYGSISHAALMGILAERDRDEADEPVTQPTKDKEIPKATLIKQLLFDHIAQTDAKTPRQ